LAFKFVCTLGFESRGGVVTRGGSRFEEMGERGRWWGTSLG